MDKPNALGISADEYKAIEQTRQRLFQLSNSIQGLKNDVYKSNPLPPPASLQAQSQILLRNLQTLLDTLTENTHVFQHLHVFPDAAYPGRTQENILLQLLRKKLEPGVEEWVERGRETTRELRAARGGDGDGEARLEEVWREVRSWTVERVQRYVLEEAGDVYTAEEHEAGIEHVRTGLKRGLEEDDESDEEDEDVVMEGQQEQAQAATPAAQKGPEPELLFWFGARGDFELPKNVELLSQAGTKRGPMGGRQ
ncbi:Mediator of RNA polymerase II transcription subunit 8 [Colletotrichum trifolii]|uniref:Mediator of RNA polymerase II transcription subunit 8 n=1 Tax=Colletotrichum trifolii TaxID=5466 RepID=A0A4R8RM90_COLTR|nr:Mediator of RNA polymerase II transcription subunit 8 [Colletotrichum trifolii]